jgi:hypothetical protein
VRQTTSDASGNYSIPFLPAGEYSISATLKGFQAQKVDRITLQVQQTARVDFKLQVGNANESVEVVASGVALQTENSSVGTMIDAGKTVGLPLNGRNFIQQFQALSPARQAPSPYGAGADLWASRIRPPAHGSLGQRAARHLQSLLPRWHRDHGI